MDEIFIEEVKTGKVYYAKDARPDSYLFKHRRLPQDSWKYPPPTAKGISWMETRRFQQTIGKEEYS